MDWYGERNPDYADVLTDRILETLTALATRPIGRPGERDGTFEKRVLRTPYLLIFALDEDELKVLRLFHLSQDRSEWTQGMDEPQA